MNAWLLSLSEEDVQPLCLDHARLPVAHGRLDVVEERGTCAEGGRAARQNCPTRSVLKAS